MFTWCAAAAAVTVKADDIQCVCDRQHEDAKTLDCWACTLINASAPDRCHIVAQTAVGQKHLLQVLRLCVHLDARDGLQRCQQPGWQERVVCSAGVERGVQHLVCLVPVSNRGHIRTSGRQQRDNDRSTEGIERQKYIEDRDRRTVRGKGKYIRNLITHKFVTKDQHSWPFTVSLARSSQEWLPGCPQRLCR